MPSYSQSLSLGMGLRQKMSLSQTQSLAILQLPLLELREAIQRELEENPALELVKDAADVSLDEVSGEAGGGDDFFEDGARGDGGADEHRRFIEALPEQAETLQESLLWQLRLSEACGPAREAAEVLIQNLDHDGFTVVPLDELFAARSMPWGDDRALFDRAVERVRRLDPAGCCVSGYRESLGVQARIFFEEDAPAMEALLPFLGDMEKGRFGRAARAAGLSREAAGELFERVKTLAPFPGRAFASRAESGGARRVIPDVRILFAAGEQDITLNGDEVPVLGVSPFFAGRCEAGGPERDFARAKVRDARLFIQSIRRRGRTLLRVSRALAEAQKNFFFHGPRFLAPLSLRDIAAGLGLHEATVSRAVNGKYAQTAWGIFELRRFFTNSISGAGSGGSRYSRAAVQEIIKEIAGTEGGGLSDMEITRRLKERGITLARRTVAKYRAQMDMASSYGR